MNGWFFGLCLLQVIWKESWTFFIHHDLVGFIPWIQGLFKFWEGTQDCSRGAANKWCLISHWGCNLIVFLELLQETQGSSPVANGNSVNLSCCHGWVRLPFELQEAPRDSSRREIGPHLELSRETQGSSPVMTRILGFLSCFNREIRPNLLRHETPLFSWVVKGV